MSEAGARNNVGRVSQITGAVVDVQFEGELPFIQNALVTKMGDRTLVMAVSYTHLTLPTIYSV